MSSNNEALLIGTWSLSILIGVSHRALKGLVKRYISDFEEFGVIPTIVKRKTGRQGREIEEFLLNEEQSLYLILMAPNMPEARENKMQLIKGSSLAKDYLGTIQSDLSNGEK